MDKPEPRSSDAVFFSGSAPTGTQNSRRVRGRADLYDDKFDWTPQHVGLGYKLSLQQCHSRMSTQTIHY